MEQEKRQKEITRHGLIRVGLWLGGGWLLLVLCAWGILPDREVPGILWVGLGLLTAELAILWGKTWWESRGRGQAIPAGAPWWQAEKEELAAAAVMLAVWWGFLALCAAGVLPHMEPDRYSWLLAGAVTVLFGAAVGGGRWGGRPGSRGPPPPAGPRPSGGRGFFPADRF